jgi:hypothetical protein
MFFEHHPGCTWDSELTCPPKIELKSFRSSKISRREIKMERVNIKPVKGIKPIGAVSSSVNLKDEDERLEVGVIAAL